ncbi:hypothetical protein HMPREF1208_01986 [Staphylococcus sp. HGB0015]|uniref:Uncharacterized protein n=1 Tax=Staphylococcus schleiferi TaxID=1295 RepID=A0A7Z7QND0_STASC|nr:hypothetical protein HMPREF1208_01986 [Staphylococcus sp. HGB0015]CAD7358914.1 Uncharacterised protein [Staphylococcus schleiferi]SUM87090.1 Uncharacterised protein [Staphylococcus schleiferi]
MLYSFIIENDYNHQHAIIFKKEGALLEKNS